MSPTPPQEGHGLSLLLIISMVAEPVPPNILLSKTAPHLGFSQKANTFILFHLFGANVADQARLLSVACMRLVGVAMCNPP